MLVYLIGASGVGKDSLLVALRQQRPDLLVAHRYITRASGLGEDSLALSEAEFLARRGRGLFCLDWQAMGCTTAWASRSSAGSSREQRCCSTVVVERCARPGSASATSCCRWW